VDRYLAHLIPPEDDENPLELEVTLNVGGALVSGGLISERTYFDLMADKVHNIAPNIREELEARVDARIRRRLEEGEGEAPSEAELEAIREEAIVAGLDAGPRRLVGSYDRSEDTGKFVHLRDAVIRTGALPGGLTADLWRGNLEAVDGFSLGRPSEDYAE